MDAPVASCLYGFFVYLDEHSAVCGLNALGRGNGLVSRRAGLFFSGPFKLSTLRSPQLRQRLHDAGRVRPVTVKEIAQHGVRGFCWVGPAEHFDELVEKDVAARSWGHGAFFYFFPTGDEKKDCYYCIGEAPQDAVDQFRAERSGAMESNSRRRSSTSVWSRDSRESRESSLAELSELAESGHEPTIGEKEAETPPNKSSSVSPMGLEPTIGEKEAETPPNKSSSVSPPLHDLEPRPKDARVAGELRGQRASDPRPREAPLESRRRASRQLSIALREHAGPERPRQIDPRQIEDGWSRNSMRRVSSIHAPGSLERAREISSMFDELEAESEPQESYRPSRLEANPRCSA